MSTWKNAIRRREHRERAQPSYREKWGLLEKKKDYKKRADNYAFKQKRLAALRRKAAERNPDEFYYKMLGTKTKNGVHQVTHSNKMTADMLKVLKTQDIGYVQTARRAEEKKIERMKASLQLVDTKKDEGRKHLVFVDTEEEAKAFDTADYFDTVPELVGDAHHRPRKAQLKDKDFTGDMTAKQLRKVAKKRRSAYDELSARVKRADKLATAQKHFETQKNLLGKGKRMKVKGAEGDEPVVFKWKPIRKK